MAKKANLSIVDIWNWLVNEVLETGELNANEQATLIHIVAKINRNIWRPVKINSKVIAAAIGRDNRTVQTAINKLVDLNILQQSEGGISIGAKYYSIATTDFQDEREDTARDTTDSKSITSVSRPAGRKRRIFN